MKNYSSALALAAALALPMSAAQAAVEFGGDYEVNAYTLDMGDLQDDDTAALQHRLRLQAHFQNDDGVQVNARVSLLDSTWHGHEGAPVNDFHNVFNEQAGSDVTLDYGYVQIPTQFGVLRVGRQETSWAHGLLVEEARRDRVLFITKAGGATVMAFADKVDEGELDVDDDLYTVNLGATGSYNNWLWGLLGVYYMAEDEATGTAPARDDFFIFSPFIQGEVGGVNLKAAANISTGFEREESTGGILDDETGIAAMLRAGVPVGPVEIEGQILYAQDGGIVDRGFDTFSSFVNNNPVSDANPLSVLNVGGPTSGDHLVAALRLSGNITEFVKVSLTGGIVDLDDGDMAALGVPGYYDDSAEFYELNAYYQATPSTTIWATVGQFAAEDILGDDIVGYSLNLRTDF